MVGVAGFEPAVTWSQARWDAKLPHTPVGIAGAEPAASGPPDQRSAAELYPVASGWQESDLLPPRPERGALPMSYNPWSGDAGNRTRSATLARRARCLSYSSPGARRMAPAGLAWVLTLLSWQCPGTFTSQGGAPHGWKELNPLYRLWRPAAYRSLHPHMNRKPPSGFPGAASGCCLWCYPEASRLACPFLRAAIGCESGYAHVPSSSRLMTDQSSTDCLPIGCFLW